MSFENELRLAYALALNAVVLAAAYRFASRRTSAGGDVVRRWIDAGLIYYLLQYVVIGGLGLVGLLSPWTIGPLALMLSAALWTVSGRRRDEVLEAAPPATSRLDRVALLACFTFVAMYALCYIHHQRHLPPTADDALTYHLPAAVQWLQTGRTGLFPTWFFNPANTYSPLGASLFMAWLIAPVGNDALVRFVQLGPLLLMFLVIVEIARLLGARGATAALIAAAAVMTRSFVNQVVVPKDDLFLTVFCLMAVMSLARRRAATADADAEPWAPWRFGASIGLLLAMKYTAMFSLPIVLLMADVPFRSARRQKWGWLIALFVVVAIAGPWYVRNAILTGNPLFPVDLNIGGVHVRKGLFATARSAELRAATLMGGHSFYGPPRNVMFALALLWAGALVRLARSGLRDPLTRACLFGPPLSIALFMATAPYPEVRFIYPAIALLFCCAAALASKLKRGGDVATATALFVLVLGTTVYGLAPNPKPFFALTALGATILVAAGFALPLQASSKRLLWRTAAGVGAVVFASYAFVFWSAYLRQYAAGRAEPWSVIYGDAARAWAVVDRDVPAGAVIAYTNTYLVYPLQGFHVGNRVVYVPAKPGLRTMRDLTPSSEPLTGEQIPNFFARQVQAGADARTWRANLVASGADVLFIAKRSDRPAPEAAFVAERPAAFEKLYEDAGAAVYRIRDAAAPAD
ncbi:MAG: hypothetical protein WBD40_03725 [Tepidisphaeraceae bacterium]